ncbi:hypothetical protein [Zavarzinia aquatilis]|uniref:Uncharacterized protein n=1 Tax=Zavarzinia aquatilis TaxID=2211142 RepID=A0A317EEM0_9PROT|nr:hypothetical protein [Zavarzinia aquatilis]PWR25488.1 hypothetical protein DKG74_00480 [Zavarzinia aquatilis]
MAGVVTYVWTAFWDWLVIRSDLPPVEIRNSFDDLLDQAQSTNGMLVIGGVLVLAWLTFRVFR